MGALRRAIVVALVVAACCFCCLEKCGVDGSVSSVISPPSILPDGSGEHASLALLQVASSRARKALSKPPIEPPKQFALREKLGEGSFGAVFRASTHAGDPTKASEVAVKTVYQEQADAENTAALLDEIAVMDSLWADPDRRPTGIVRYLGYFIAPALSTRKLLLQQTVFPERQDSPLYYMGTLDMVTNLIESNKQLFLVIELCTGGDVWHAAVNDRFNGHPERAYRVIHTLLEAITFISTPTTTHTAIVHRDIKLENIVLCDASYSSTKLIDFGVAAAVDPATGLLPSSQQSRFCGTADTVSPEMLCLLGLCPRALEDEYKEPSLLRSDLMFAKDVWAAGVILEALLVHKNDPQTLYWTNPPIDPRAAHHNQTLATLRNVFDACNFPEKVDGKDVARFDRDTLTEKYGSHSNVMKALNGMLACRISQRMRPQEALKLLEISAVNPAYESSCRTTCVRQCEAFGTPPSHCQRDCRQAKFDFPDRPIPCAPEMQFRRTCKFCDDFFGFDSDVQQHELAAHAGDDCALTDSQARQIMVNPFHFNCAELAKKACKMQCQTLVSAAKMIQPESLEQLAEIWQYVEPKYSGFLTASDVESALLRYSNNWTTSAMQRCAHCCVALFLK